MVVLCPKCKTKLRVNDSRLSASGSRFKCPKCAAVLFVKKPAAEQKKNLDGDKILVAHSNPEILESIKSILSPLGCKIVTAPQGIDAVVKAMKERPSLAVMEVALPKIYGFEVCKRLKSRPETKGMKFILIASIYDKKKYRREPVSLYGADDYLEEHEISEQLLDKTKRILRQSPPESPSKETSKPQAGKPQAGKPEASRTQPGTEARVAVPPLGSISPDEKVEKAKRLARTIINDIYLYNAAKVEDSIKNGDFYQVFASELRESRKLYDSRVSVETRAGGDFFNEAIENFLTAKKDSLS